MGHLLHSVHLLKLGLKGVHETKIFSKVGFSFDAFAFRMAMGK